MKVWKHADSERHQAADVDDSMIQWQNISLQQIWKSTVLLLVEAFSIEHWTCAVTALHAFVLKLVFCFKTSKKNYLDCKALLHQIVAGTLVALLKTNKQKKKTQKVLKEDISIVRTVYKLQVAMTKMLQETTEHVSTLTEHLSHHGSLWNWNWKKKKNIFLNQISKYQIAYPSSY